MFSATCVTAAAIASAVSPCSAGGREASISVRQAGSRSTRQMMRSMMDTASIG